MQHSGGGTRWRRAALVGVPAMGVVGALGFTMSQGILAAEFAVSGQSFTIFSSTASAEAFGAIVSESQQVGGDGSAAGVAVAGIGAAQLDGLCASVNQPVPILGSVLLRVSAGTPGNGDLDVSAENLVLEADAITADGTLSGLQLGRDASTLDQGPVLGNPGGFGLQAETAVLDNLNANAYSATIAGSVTLNNLSITVDIAGEECGS